MDAAPEPHTTQCDAAADMQFGRLSRGRRGRSLAVLFTCILLTAGCGGPSPADAGDTGGERADGGRPDACEGGDADGDGVADVCDACEGHDDILAHRKLTDTDGDGDLDIVSMWAQAGGLVLVNDGAGHYAPHSGFPIAEAEGSDFAVELTDVDGDGYPDAVVASQFNISNGLGGLISVWQNDGLGHLSDTGQRLGPTRVNAWAAADFDGNGGPDLFVANQGHFHVWLNQ